MDEEIKKGFTVIDNLQEKLHYAVNLYQNERLLVKENNNHFLSYFLYWKRDNSHNQSIEVELPQNLKINLNEIHLIYNNLKISQYKKYQK